MIGFDPTMNRLADALAPTRSVPWARHARAAAPGFPSLLPASSPIAATPAFPPHPQRPRPEMTSPPVPPRSLPTWRTRRSDRDRNSLMALARTRAPALSMGAWEAQATRSGPGYRGSTGPRGFMRHSHRAIACMGKGYLHTRPGLHAPDEGGGTGEPEKAANRPVDR